MIRRRLVCRGVVQGVGFRPAVYRLGNAFGLHGHVRNGPEGATIEVQGEAAAVEAFEAQLAHALPPLARLDRIERFAMPPIAARGFEVAETLAGRRGQSMVPPDAALCAACRQELDDRSNRRYRYPFITCTDCGPRFSLVSTLPYDRERTAMACFPLCPACAAEYSDPASRRFHAEAICCAACGPRLWCSDATGQEVAGPEAALDLVRERLAAGAIVAIKGLGGFQIACRADRADAVARLRTGKRRPAKPFAVMVRDLATAREIVRLDAEAEVALASAAGPIVLAERHATRAPSGIADEVAPGLTDLGVMLPTTGLHVELFRDAPFAALVMTSGNRREQPICLGNREALQNLAGVADLFLLHDRDIVRRVDDSVVRATSGGTVMVRRSRGHAPAALPLPVSIRGHDPAASAVLAVGGHLQNTVCIASGDRAFVSQHVGDLDSEPTRRFQREVVAGLEQFLEVRATTIVADTHPDYPSTWLAQELAVQRRCRLLQVPHHLAHAAAVLGENDAFPAVDARAAALVLDGTGHGPGAAAWGSELLCIDGRLRWSRMACGEAMPLVGGETAVREPWRIAAAVLARAGRDAMAPRLPLATAIDAHDLQIVTRLALHCDWPSAHGAGRLFEAAGALLGLCVRNDYEGEAAARLEALAASWCDDGEPPWPEVTARDAAVVPQPQMLLALADRLLAGEHPARCAFGLHRTFAATWVRAVQFRWPGLGAIALGGGCFVNRLLLQEFTRAFAAIGCAVRTAVALPPGDGGLAYGQTVIAAAAAARACEPSFESIPEV